MDEIAEKAIREYGFLKPEPLPLTPEEEEWVELQVSVIDDENIRAIARRALAADVAAKKAEAAAEGREWKCGQ